jgi:hypothetical protein
VNVSGIFSKPGMMKRGTPVQVTYSSPSGAHSGSYDAETTYSDDGCSLSFQFYIENLIEPGTWNVSAMYPPVDGLVFGHTQVQVVPLDPKQDLDGDGLLNSWEQDGIDINQDGQVDLNLATLGADPYHKDVFLEIDYMGHHKPFDKSISDLFSVFGDSPVSNPDGSNGIRLHVDIDDNIPHSCYTTWDKDYPLIKTEYFGTAKQRSDLNAENIIRAKREAYNYGVFGHSGGAWGAGGEWQGYLRLVC